MPFKKKASKLNTEFWLTYKEIKMRILSPYRRKNTFLRSKKKISWDKEEEEGKNTIAVEEDPFAISFTLFSIRWLSFSDLCKILFFFPEILSIEKDE